jgi:hypothetical protein
MNEVRYWTKHLNISKEDLQKTINKVGNSAAAVRKELAVWARGLLAISGAGSPRFSNRGLGRATEQARKASARKLYGRVHGPCLT